MKEWKVHHVCSDDTLARLRARDPEEQRAFWCEYWPDLHSLCCRAGSDGPSADEIVAEVLAEFLFRYVDRMEHPAAVWSYLRLMAVRRVARNAEETSGIASQVEDLVEKGPDPEDAALLQLMLPRLAFCLGKLKPKARQVVQLRYGSSLSNQQIGSLLGDSKQYIGRVLTSSLTALKKCLLMFNKGRAIPAAGREER